MPGLAATPADVENPQRLSDLLNQYLTLTESVTLVGDANYTMVSTDNVVKNNVNFTASRTWTLPLAKSVNKGHRIVVVVPNLSSTIQLTIARQGTDTIYSSVQNSTITSFTSTPGDVGTVIELVRADESTWAIIARRGSLENASSVTSVGDTNYTILPTDKFIAQSAAFTAPRTWTLPLASADNLGQVIYIWHWGSSGTNTLTLAAQGSDTFWIKGLGNLTTVTFATDSNLQLINTGTGWVVLGQTTLFHILANPTFCNLSINNQDSIHNAEVDFAAGGATKWQVGKDGGNNFFVFDNAQSANALSMVANGGVATFNRGVLSNQATQGIGYSTGAGGAVTQATSKSTAVTLNKICGVITMNNAALAAGASVAFVVNNSTVAATDVPVGLISGGAVSVSNYRVNIKMGAAGVFTVELINISAGSLSEAVTINFAIIKAVNS